ncbi:MAG: hypothetical protein RI562_11860 [Salibacter sp.]|uniref:toxin-antitoxin system YwqK family antitoxin n=1 Tax=Salibacter sp. TaxID=2010995 RepID=UPI0028701691|nr:hypothetical protein [Salibacter sp.]MDR9399749.1 hypothetical protein [Salibacter sp.]
MQPRELKNIDVDNNRKLNFLKPLYVIVLLIAFLHISCDDKVKKELYKDGKLKKVIYLSDGEVYKIENYATKGILSAEYEIKNDQKHGMAKLYFMDGSIKSSLKYKNGEKHGICYLYNKNGGVFKKFEFKEGELVKEFPEPE